MYDLPEVLARQQVVISACPGPPALAREFSCDQSWLPV